MGAGCALPFVAPGTDAAARVYERVGDQRIGEMLHLVLDGGPPTQQ